MKRQIAHGHPNFSSCTNWLSKGPEELLRRCVLAASLATVPWGYQHASSGGRKKVHFLTKEQVLTGTAPSCRTVTKEQP